MANQTQMAVQARVKDRRHPDQSVSKSVRQAGREAVLQAAFCAPQRSLSVPLLFSEGSRVPEGLMVVGNHSKAVKPPSKQKERNVHSPKRCTVQSPKIKA